MTDFRLLEPTWEQVQDMREVDAASLVEGDQIFAPGMGTAYRTTEDGQVRFMGFFVNGGVWTVRAVHDGTMVATNGDQVQQGPTADRKFIRMGGARG